MTDLDAAVEREARHLARLLEATTTLRGWRLFEDPGGLAPHAVGDEARAAAKRGAALCRSQLPQKDRDTP